jgi:SAM-dependent methyltransferase
MSDSSSDQSYLSSRLGWTRDPPWSRRLRISRMWRNYAGFIRPPVLEIGPGRGYGYVALRELGFAEGYVGLDLDAAVVGDLAVRFPGVEFVCSRGRVLKDCVGGYGPFNTVIAQHVLEHVERDGAVRFLEDLSSSLSEGGRLIVEVPNAGHPFLGSFAVFDDYTHRAGYTLDSLCQVLRLSGLVVERARGVGTLSIYPISWVAALRLLPAWLLCSSIAVMFAKSPSVMRTPAIFAVGRRTTILG